MKEYHMGQMGEGRRQYDAAVKYLVKRFGGVKRKLPQYSKEEREWIEYCAKSVNIFCNKVLHAGKAAANSKLRFKGKSIDHLVNQEI